MADSFPALARYVLTTGGLAAGLVGFALGARASLNTWTAVQAVDADPRLDKKLETKITRINLVMSILAIVSLVGVEIYCFSTKEVRIIDRFLTIVFAGVFQVMLNNAFVDLTKAQEWAVHRGPSRILHFRAATGSRSYVKLVVAVLLAAAVNAATYYELHWACGTAVIAALVYSRLGSPPGKSFSIRLSIIVYSIYMSVVTALVGFAVVAAIKTRGDADQAPSDDEADAAPGFDFASPRVMRYMELFMTGIYQTISGLVIAACLRFDHANAVEASPELFAPPQLASSQVPDPTLASILSEGVVLPRSFRTRFAKPYYTTALVSWLLAQLVATAMFAAVLPVPQTFLDSGAFVFLATYLSCISISVSLCVVAASRGEFIKMWKYKETWIPKADKGVQLDEANSTNDDARSVASLPAYEAAADDKAAVPATKAAPAYDLVDRKA
ncbi:hypothetical protein JCM10212_004554 [Sporobolomyces blumeae]